MNPDIFTPSVEQRYFEDYITGARHEFGSITVEADEVIAFAKRFDPQPFHTDPEAGKLSIYRGMIASGWHTAALMMRLFVDHYREIPGTDGNGSGRENPGLVPGDPV